MISRCFSAYCTAATSEPRSSDGAFAASSVNNATERSCMSMSSLCMYGMYRNDRSLTFSSASSWRATPSTAAASACLSPSNMRAVPRNMLRGNWSSTITYATRPRGSSSHASRMPARTSANVSPKRSAISRSNASSFMNHRRECITSDRPSESTSPNQNCRIGTNHDRIVPLPAGDDTPIRPRSVRRAARDPLVDPLAQHGQADRAAAQQQIVERLHVELRPQPLLGVARAGARISRSPSLYASAWPGHAM